MINLYKKIWFLFDYNEKKRVVLLFLLMIIMAFFEVLGVGSIMPFLSVLGNPETIETNKYLSTVYNYFNFENKDSFLMFLGTFALFMLFISAAIRSITSYARFRFSNLRRHSLGQKLLKKYLQQPYSFFLSRNSSDVSKVILSETDLAVGQAILPSLNLLTYIIMTIALICFLILVDPILAFILASVFGGFYIIMYFSVKNHLSKIGNLRNEANTNRFKITSETIGGIKDLKILGREKIYLDSFKKPSYEFSHFQSISATLVEVPQFLVEVVAFGALLAMAMYTLADEGNEVGSILPILGLYAMGALKLKPAINIIYKSLGTMKFAESAINNITEDLKQSSQYIDIKNDNKRLKLENSLKLDNLNFVYPNTVKMALENINIDIEANTTVGIIGTTGAGKSTLIDMILGLLYPTKGRILIDQKELNLNNIRQWQNSIGYVPQNIFLSDDSITKNIAFGLEKDAINIEQVKNAARMAQIHKFIISLEDDYNTVIGERGVRLSGGQRQRLGIARALYHNPELLVLDEATSALDNKTELEVMKAINNMSGSKTIIMIAHRLSTVERCDKIIKLENGKIVDIIISNKKKGI